MTRFRLAAFILSLAAAPAARAQLGPLGKPQPPVAPDTGRLAPVVVTPTRDSVTQNAATAATTVISGAELRAQGIVTVGQALSSIASITTVQESSYGSTTSLFTRGGQSDYTLILVDGAPVNDPGGFVDIANLTTDNVERIEVVRGPGSVLYGSDAVSGVIQIFTRKGSTGNFGSVSYGVGAFHSTAGDFSLGLGKETASFTMDAARYRTNGTLAFNNGYSNDVYSFAGHLGQAGQAHLDVSGRQTTADYHFPTDFTGAAVDSNQRTAGTMRVGSLDGGVYLRKAVELRFLGTYTQNKGTSENLPDNTGDSTSFYYVDPSDQQQWSGDLRFAFHFSPATIFTLGGAYEHQQVSSSDSSWSNTFTDTSSFAHSRYNTGWYGNVTGDLGAHFSYNVGIRFTDSQQFGHFTTYRLAGGYAFTASTSVRGSIGTAFREPSFTEEYASGFAMGNPSLAPEKGASWELGITQGFGAHNATTVSLGYFAQRFTDMIQYDPSVPPGTPNYENIAEATANGVEAEAHAVLSQSWMLDAGYTWLKTNVVDAGVSGGPAATLVTGEPLLRRPANAGNVSLTYHMPKKLMFMLQGVFVGSRADVDYVSLTRVTMPSYTLVNASLLLTLKSDNEGRFLAVSFRGTNLLNTGYQQTYGFAAPGRGYLVGLRVGIEK